MLVDTGERGLSRQADVPLRFLRVGGPVLFLIRLEYLTRDLVGQRRFLFRIEDADVARLSGVVELRLLRSMGEINRVDLSFKREKVIFPNARTTSPEPNYSPIFWRASE